MPDTDTRSRLQAALEDACAFARTHGLEITPADFALQRSMAGHQHATHISEEFVISVEIAPFGEVVISIGEIDWIAGRGGEWPRPTVDVYLPGDAPKETTRA